MYASYLRMEEISNDPLSTQNSDTYDITDLQLPYIAGMTGEPPSYSPQPASLQLKSIASLREIAMTNISKKNTASVSS